MNPVYRVGRQVEESLRIHRPALSGKERHSRALEALRLTELADAERIADAYPHQLSGGQRQRAMIAAAMVCGPKLLIADEPTTALDVTVQAQIVELLLRINREQKTAILFISHDLSLVAKLCSRVLVMHSGAIVEQGPAREVFLRPAHDYTKKLVAAIPRVEPASDGTISPAAEIKTGGKDRNGEAETREAEKQEALVEKKRGTLGAEKQEILRVENLSVSYPGRGAWPLSKKRLEAVHSVSFSVRRGEVVGLVGESGCGKSTLARAILGLEPANGGTVSCGDRRPQMIFQDPFSSLNPAYRVGRILEEPLRIQGGFSRGERREKVSAMLEKVGLSESLAQRYPAQLSGGQRQRVCIGAALMQGPGLLVADEAVSALDVTIQAQILDLLLSLKKEMGLSILFISHDMRLVYRLCDRVMVMRDGHLLETGDTGQVYFHSRQPYTRQLLRAAGIGAAP